MMKILGIGNALVDVMTILKDDSTLDRFNLPKGSMQLVDKEKSEIIKAGTSMLERILASGGSAANTIHGLAKLGIATGFIGSTGNDEMGDFFENDMKKAGVSTILSRHDTPTGNAIALISADSERTFATYLGAAVELMAEDLDPANFKGYDILYLEGYLIYNKPLVIEACEIAVKNGMKIALDLASYNVVEANLADFREVVSNYVDILFANEEEARAFTGLDPEKALESLAELCHIAIIKTGAEGSLIRRGDEVIRIIPPKVKVVDTTGAGDLYAAGFLYGYSRKLNLELCGEYGTLLAGKVIGITGAKMDDQQWAEIQQIISSAK